MESHGGQNGRNRSTSHSIPLRDLHRAPEHNQYGDGGTQSRRTNGDRSRQLTRQQTGDWDMRYEPLSEHSPAPSRNRNPPTLRTDSSPGRGGAHDGDYSPVEDRSAFQAAIGFAGLSFQGESLEPLDPHPQPGHRRASSRPLMSGNNESDPYLPGPAFSEPENRQGYSSGPYDDTAPLAGEASPISGAEPSTPAGRHHSRNSVRFQTVDIRTGMLGDSLNNVEAGLRHSAGDGMRHSFSHKRSLSPSTVESPLHRAGTIMRNMSQRVVNLSNEPEVAERNLRRKSSLRQARLQEPPSFPAMTQFAHDGTSSPPSPIEKPPSPLNAEFAAKGYRRPPSNPLRGKSLGIFPPDNKLRIMLCDLLVHPITEPSILLLIVVQTILLVIDSSANIKDNKRINKWETSWVDNALLIIFIIYTVELLIRMIVSGFIINPTEYSTINRQIGFRQAIFNKGQEMFSPYRRQSTLKNPRTIVSEEQPSIIGSFTPGPANPELPSNSRHQQRARLARRAVLRHSWPRLDFLAVVSFWISVLIKIFSNNQSDAAAVFQMLSCLRILRLLALTNGTSVILRSLKKAAPLLVHVAFLICFFWLLFAIVGVQSFKSSLRRTCIWTDSLTNETFINDGAITGDYQFCGGWVDESNKRHAAIDLNGVPLSGSHAKGYLCPVGSKCVQRSNPYNGTVSFDNIFHSLELVFVVMSSNTWSDLLYYLADSDYLVSALFFAVGIVILPMWLISLLIAVITSSFQVIREESKASAFTGQESEPLMETNPHDIPKTKISPLKRMYDRTSWIWILVITYGILCQCLRSASMSHFRERFINLSETFVTFILLFEIILRFVVDWRHFFFIKRNWVDLFFAVVTTIIQLPAIKKAHDGEAYAWLSIFQILRIYRVVMALPMTRDLILVVLGNASGLLNLIFFVFLLVFLVAIFASQLYRNRFPDEDASGETIRINFSTLYNSFIGMYQILSSENWTSILYTATNYTQADRTSWVAASFFIMWYILANFIVLNMFIAVIQEGFDVSEDEKRLQQVKAFLQQKESGFSNQGNPSLSRIFKFGALGRHKDPLDFGSAATEMLLKDAVVKDFLDEHGDAATLPPPDEHKPSLRPARTLMVSGGTMSDVWGRILSTISNREPNPFYSRLEFSRAYEDLDPRQMAKEVVSATDRRKRAQREYLRKHPNYNVSMFVFKPDNPIRRICQRIVGPGRGGDRIEGLAPSLPVWYAFSAFIYAAIVAMVLLACVTTPVYQKEYFDHHEFSVRNWFVWSDMGFAILFSVEAVIKVIADGFFWTPNAYFRSSWGFIDGIVLITLWINVGTSLYSEGQISRAVGAFKALRALRLLNVSDSARDHFHWVIVRGWKIISAAFVSLSLLIPFAIYGLNLFHGKMEQCNDGNSDIVNLYDCVGEFSSSPYAWDVLAPRVASNDYFDFDNFGNSLFILFQIVSQEGWTDVMWAAQSITGVFTQPQAFASQGNAVFFIVFNLLGAVFVLTLFVSIFMRNYTEQTGVAFLTTDQRSWLELRKLLRQVSPSKRPSSTQRRESWEEWCYRRAIRKTGRWQRFITVLLIVHLILLCLEYDPSPEKWDKARVYIFFIFTLFFAANVFVRVVGLTWSRFRKSSWDIYSVFAVSGTFITTILVFTDFKQRVYLQLHKLCLVSIALLLIPRNNQLDQLFKTAAASLPAISNLLATWFVLFLVYAIALTQAFGLTRFGGGESGNINFRSVPKALILLFRISIGEGWNSVMEDFASVTPPLCVVHENFLRGDCGSPEWARALFITWNVFSMYIFVNLFVSLIYESFSYVYQRSHGLSAISREEIRRFKQAWAEFDPNGTGFITKEAFPRLLGELSGIFEMRVYDGDFTVRRLIEDSSRSRRTSELPVQRQDPVVEIDLALLNHRLRDLPVKEIRQRRARMNVFYEEVLVGADPDRGIGFNQLLMTLAHYKVINDNKSLRLEEFLRRRARLQRVEEAVRRNVVVGFFDTLYWSRKFRRFQASKQEGRMTVVPQFTVPEIFVDDEDITNADRERAFRMSPMVSPVQTRMREAALRSSGGADLGSPTALRSRANSIQTSPIGSPIRGSYNDGAGNPHWSFAAALSRPPSPLDEPGPSDAARSRANSSVSAQDVLEVLDNSAWGESIRRSFTMRRSPSGR